MRMTRRKSGSPIVVLIALAMVLIAAIFFFMNPFKNASQTAVHAASGKLANEEAKNSDQPETKNQEKNEPAPADLELLSKAAGQKPMTGSPDTKKLKNVHIPAGSLFSLRSWLDSKDADLSEWSEPAGILLEASLLAGLEPVERSISLTLPEYAKLGYEADLSETTKDLKLYNANPFDVWVSAALQSGKLEVSIKGQPDENWKAPDIEVAEDEFKPETMLLLDYGKKGKYAEKPGKSGLMAKVYRVVDGKKQILYKDFYAPIPEVETRGPNKEESELLQIKGSLETAE